MIKRLSMSIALIVLSTASAAAHQGLQADIDHATEAIEKSPAQADLYVERAYLERLAGALGDAMTDLDRARKLDPGSLRVAAERGMTFSAMGRDSEAEAELTRFLDQGAGTGPLFAERAKVRARLGRTKPAIADYSSAIVLRPDMDYYMARGALQESIRDLAGAAMGYREGIARVGDAVNLDLALIRVETALKRYDDALRLVDDQLARAQVKTDWYLRRAEVLDAAGRVSEAQSDRETALGEADRAVELNASGMHLFSRAKAQAALGHIEAAKQDLELVLGKSPGFTEAQELLARLDAADNDKGMRP